ncbi:MAG: sugar ABC transporter substrate-binding protein [Mesorhizobium sp.]|nr:MAG: sugar ABC transporter substrate-binding protein [Mesorhizobium sp.]
MKAGVFFAGLAVVAVTLLSIGAVPANAQDKKPYTIYLSNNFVGNDWRQQMLRSADIAVKKPPLAGRVDLKVEVVETTVQAQINSLNNIIRNKPDAIVIDAGSGEALNPTIEKACKAGIVVIAFDQIVSAPCAYTMESDWGRAPRVEAEWLVKKLGGKGKILVDRGLAGAPISAQLQGGFEEVIKKYPGIEVVGYFNGDYALGPEQAGVASLLAAHPQVDAIFVQGYGAGAIKALQDAGRPIVPITGSPFNLTTTTCAQTHGAQCILAPNPAYLSAEALKLAVEIMDGKKPAEKKILLRNAFLTTDPVPSELYPDATMQKIEVGKNAFPDMAPGLFLPVSPDWVEITPAEAAGSK